jgi:dTDP-4-dehydrorhamnose reductase
MKVLITGADGQLGKCLINVFEGNADIYAFNRQALDITNEKLVSDTVKSIQPNIIINAAAYTAVDKAEQELDQAYAINALGPKNLAIASSQNNCILIHVSTDYVFDGKKQTPYNEIDITNPQSIYGKTKLDGEYFVSEYCDRHIILRTSWVFSEYGNNFVKTMMKLAEKENLKIVDDQIGGPTDAMDIALAISKISEITTDKNDFFGLYNFSGEAYCNWYGFAECIFSKAKELGVVKKVPKLSPIPTADYPTPATRPLNSRLDNSKIYNVFGILPSNWECSLNNLSNYKS